MMLFICRNFFSPTQHPVTWQLSTDGTRWIGHMILKKAVLEGTGPKDSSAILGKSGFSDARLVLCYLIWSCAI